jgi:hypothetical protein
MVKHITPETEAMPIDYCTGSITAKHWEPPCLIGKEEHQYKPEEIKWYGRQSKERGKQILEQLRGSTPG